MKVHEDFTIMEKAQDLHHFQPDEAQGLHLVESLSQ